MFKNLIEISGKSKSKKSMTSPLAILSIIFPIAPPKISPIARPDIFTDFGSEKNMYRIMARATIEIIIRSGVFTGDLLLSKRPKAIPEFKM